MADKYRDELEDMVWQFAYRNDNETLTTGGLSTLEGAFTALGWKDPHKVKDEDGVICDVKGCHKFVVAQGGIWDAYWCLCLEHYMQGRNNSPKPIMKQRAIDRENSRNKETGILPLTGGKECFRFNIDMEICPKCGGQLIYCGCIDDDENNYQFITTVGK